MEGTSLDMASTDSLQPCNWTVGRLKALTSSWIWDMRPGWDVLVDDKCLKILPRSSDPTSWLLEQLQKLKRNINDSSLARLSLLVEMSAGLIVPKTAFTCKSFWLTKSCKHKMRQLRCLKRPTPTPRRDRTPLAADESKKRYLRMRIWSTQHGSVLMRMAPTTAGTAAYVSDSALDSDTIFWRRVNQTSTIENCTSRNWSSRCPISSPISVTENLEYWLFALVVSKRARTNAFPANQMLQNRHCLLR